MFNNKESELADDSTRLPLSEKNKDSHSRFHNQIIKAELKELDFMRHKCQNLKESMVHLKNQNALLKKENSRLLTLNSEYLSNVNTLYEQKMDKIEKIIFPEGLTGNKSELETAIKEYLKRAVEGFKKLENDHKKLIKHCAVIQKQNSHLKIAFDEFSRWKQSLLKVNHTDIHKLCKQMAEVQDQNEHLGSKNNHLSYQIEKLGLDLQKIGALHNESQSTLAKTQKESSEQRSAINRLTQQIAEAENIHLRELYQVQVKCDHLEKQLRANQGEINRAGEQGQMHNIEKVQFVHKEQTMMKTIKDMAAMLYASNNDGAFIDSRRGSIVVPQDKKPKRHRGSKSLSIVK